MHRGDGGGLDGFWTPDGGNIPTLYGAEVDRILYNYEGAELLKVETFMVPRSGEDVVRVNRRPKWSVSPKREVSDHRPRKLILPIY